MYRTPLGHSELTSTHYHAKKRWGGSNKDKYEAAEEATAAFKRAGLDSCVFGSLAFKLLGACHKPNDVDIIVVHTKKSREALKEYLVEEHSSSRFYLMPSHFHKSKFRVLWYATHRGTRVKVDVLRPGAMHIPAFQASLITHEIPPGQNGCGYIAVAPLELVLLLKLRGWVAHHESKLPHWRKKEPEDVRQIRALLVRYKQHFDFGRLPRKFLESTKVHVQKYMHQYPASTGSWRRVGFHH